MKHIICVSHLILPARVIASLLQMRKLGLEELNNMLKVTQPVNVRQNQDPQASLTVKPHALKHCYLLRREGVGYGAV